MGNILTILVALVKIAAIFAKTRHSKQVFQSIAILVIMVIIIRNDEERKRDKKLKKIRLDEF